MKQECCEWSFGKWVRKKTGKKLNETENRGKQGKTEEVEMKEESEE